MEIYLFKVKDYTTVLVGQYDKEQNEYFVQRGDGTKYTYSNDQEFGRIEWSEKLDITDNKIRFLLNSTYGAINQTII